MIIKIPNSHFFGSGWAEGVSVRNSLDGAFCSAGLGNISAVRVGSALTPGSRLVEFHELPPGALVPMVFASLSSTLPGEIISAGVAIAYPRDRTQAGLVMEYAASGHKQDIEALARRMVLEGMKVRGQETEEIVSIAVQHRVEKIGAVLAAVVLWE
ncbi:MAG: arginine decarboxylase, pyruvoyl-dependent [Deltaproteobacteria bacterium]|nr:arginine decarboxylase, pyruvoyl-dependent [Deltaproteobacteria bacterium]